MLSRIADLESGIALGNFKPVTTAIVENTVETVEAADEITASVPASRPQRVRRPVYDDEDDDMFKDDAPVVKKAVSGESVTQQVPEKEKKVVSESASSRQDASVRVLKPFRSRAEVLEQMDAASAMHSSFFKGAKWYTDESGRFILKFENKFAIDNMRFFDGEDFFAKIISKVTGRSISKSEIICECNEESKKDSVIDKILEAAEDEF
jgi:hypothetical protein